MSADSERVYTIPLGKVLLSPDNRRAMRAINMIREFARHHMKQEDIHIEEALSHEIWARGIRKPPRKVRVRMSKTSEGFVLVSPYLGTAPSEDADKKDADTKDADTAAKPKTVPDKADSAPESDAAPSDAGKDSKPDTVDDAPKPDTADDTPKPDAKSDAPKPDAKSDAPKPDAKK